MNKIFIFCLGAASGSLLTWKLIEKKYKDLADEEIASVVEYYRENESRIKHVETSTEYVEPKITVIETPNKEFEKECTKLM